MQQPKKPIFSKRPDDAWRDWCQTRDRIGQKLREFYRANMTEELPPRLVALIEGLDEETKPSADQPEIIRDVED
jgi:hypothetical protein